MRTEVRVDFGPADRQHPICHDALPQGGGDRPRSTFPIWDEICLQGRAVASVEAAAPQTDSARSCSADRYDEARIRRRSLLIGVHRRWLPVRRRAFSQDDRVPSVRGCAPSGTRTWISTPITIGRHAVFGAARSDFDYGLEFWRDFASEARPRKSDSTNGSAAFDDAGSIDEDGCYADAGFKTLKRRRVARRACDGRVRGTRSRPLRVSVPASGLTGAIRQAGAGHRPCCQRRRGVRAIFRGLHP